MSDTVAETLAGQVDAVRARLEALIRLPSVSTDPAYEPGMQATRTYLLDWFRKMGLQDVQQLDGGGHPALYGSWCDAPGKPTLLIYGHYDVQPPDPLEEWISPPFNDPRARLALSYIIDQDDQMAGGYGDPAYYQKCNSFFVCGSPNGTVAGAEDFGPNLARAKQLLAEAGYKGEPIRMPATRDISYMGPMAEVAADAMRKAGLNVQMEWSDWGTVVSRSANQSAPDAGGWNIYVSGEPGVLAWSPSTNIFAYMPCDRSNLSGWPCDAEVEDLRTRYAGAAAADRPAILTQLQRRLAVVNPYRMLGQATQPVAFRSNVTGILNSPVIAYWNIAKE